MDNSQAHKKGRRRSLRNLRRSSSHFVSSANVSCLETSVLEDRNREDISAIVRNYGSAWLGDENIDPFAVLNEATIFEQNAAASLNDDTYIECVERDGDTAKVWSLPADEQALSKSEKSKTPDKPCVADRSLLDSIEHFRSNDNDSIEKANGVCSPIISGLRYSSNSSVSDSLPELDLSMYGSVNDCLRTQSQGSFESPNYALLTQNKDKRQSENVLSEMLQNWNCAEANNCKNKNPNMEVRDSFNDAFMGHCHNLLNFSDGIESHDLGNNLKCASPAPKRDGEFCLQPSVNDEEMHSLCESSNINESCSMTSPKVRKISTEKENPYGYLSSDNSENSPESNSSVNKTSSILGVTMLSAIHSLASRLEALSAISSSEGDCSPKPATNSLTCSLSRSQSKAVYVPSNSDSKATKSKRTDPSLRKGHLDQSCEGGLIIDLHSLNDGDLNTSVSSVQGVKSRKCLSLNRRSSSAADNEDELAKSSPPKIETKPYCGSSEISEPLNFANEGSEENVVKRKPVPDSQAISLNLISLEENAEATAPSMDKENSSDTAQAAASNSKLEEAVLLEELSLRFPNDSIPPKKRKNRRSTGPSRRESSRWRNRPSSDLNLPGEVIQQYSSTESYLVEDIHKDLDYAGEVCLSSRKLFGSTGNSSLAKDAINNDALPAAKDNRRETTASTDILVESSCCERVEYEEQSNDVVQCSSKSDITVCETKSKRNGRPLRRSMPSTSSCEEEAQMMNVKNLVGNKSNAHISDSSSTRDSIIDHVMEDLAIVTPAFSAEDRLAHSAPEEIDFSDNNFKSQAENNQESSESSEMNDANLGVRRKSTRSQQTCKRKSWVLPTTNESSSTSNEKQKRGGRKNVGNKAKDNTASPDLANQDGTLKNTLEELKVDETLKLLYMNKLYQPPPAMRPWETIKENPVNRFNIFSRKRHPRLLTFQEGLTHTRMVRRHFKATRLNELNRNQPISISEGEFLLRMVSLERMLDS